MNLLSLLHQGVLCIHGVVFALTLSAVLREDWWLLTTRGVDARRLAHTARGGYRPGGAVVHRADARGLRRGNEPLALDA
jgi:hypothetical protein